MTICRLYFSLTPARDIVEVELNYDIYCSTTRFSYYLMFISVPHRQSQQTRQHPFLAFLAWHNVLSEFVSLHPIYPAECTLGCYMIDHLLLSFVIVPFLTDFLFILTTSITRSVLKFGINLQRQYFRICISKGRRRIHNSAYAMYVHGDNKFDLWIIPSSLS